MNELERTDLSELEAFETPVSDKPMKPIQMSVEKWDVACRIAFSGSTLKKISEETKLPLHTIQRWNIDPQFKDIVKDLILKKKEEILASNIMDLQKTLAARREKIEEEGGDYSNYSRKDSLLIAEKISDMLGEDKDKSESNYSKKLEELLLKSAERKAIDVTPS